MRILGLEIGNASVKAVELDSAFGRYEIREYYEQKVGPGVTPVQAAAQLVSHLGKAPDRLAMAAPAHQITQRNFLLPTRDRKAIRSGIQFELEDDLPFEMENAVSDYSVLSQSAGGSQVHISVTLKTHLTEFLESLKANHLDPDVVTTESWAYRSYINRILSRPAQEAPLLLIRMGETQTALYSHWQGIPVSIRTLDWGSAHLSQAIAKEYRMTVEEAEQAKLSRGIGFAEPSGPSPNPVEGNHFILKGHLQIALQQFILAIKQSILTCKNMTQQNTSLVYFTGEGCLIPGLAEILQQELNLPVERLQALSAVSLSGVAYSEPTDAAFLLPVALALCMVGQERSVVLNFRKGHFAKTRTGRTIDFRSLKKPMISAGIVTACLCLSLIIESFVYQSRLSALDLKLERSVRGFFGSLAGPAVKSYLSNPSKLKDSIQKQLKTERELAALMNPNTQSPLLFLKTLSARTPSSLVVDMTKFQVGAAPDAPYQPEHATDASLTFIVANPQMIEKLEETLKNHLTDIQRSQPEEVKSSSGNKWKVTFTGKPMEEAYGR